MFSRIISSKLISCFPEMVLLQCPESLEMLLLVCLCVCVLTMLNRRVNLILASLCWVYNNNELLQDKIIIMSLGFQVFVEIRVSIVVQWIKLPLRMPVYHIGALVQVPATQLPIQLPDSLSGKAVKDAHTVGLLPLLLVTTWSSWLLASACQSPDCCSHVESKLTHGRSLFFK